MITRRLDPRFVLFAGLAVTGCSCDEEGLVDARARLAVTPESLDFGDVVLGDFRVMGVEISNTGSIPLRIDMKALVPPAGEFALASPVPDALAAQEKLQINFLYQPVDLGEDLGSFTLGGDDGMDPKVISLRGVGVQAGAGVQLEGDACAGVEGSMSFGNVVPGMSAERSITITSNGGAPLNVISAVVEPGSSGEWSIDASALPKTLAAGEQLVLVATYSPVDGGSDSGAFIITTDAVDTPSIRVPVCGVGVAPALCASPVPLDLGAVPDGMTVTGRVTLESCGVEPLELSAIAMAMDAAHMSSPDFALVTIPTVPATLAPGATVEVEVSYTSRIAAGAGMAWVQVTSNAHGAPETYVPVTARPAQPCTLFVAPADLYFQNVGVGMTARRNVLVGNSGESACEVGALNISTMGGGNEFTLVSPPATPFTLGSGGNQTLEIEYAPTGMGPHEGQLDIVDAGGAAHTVLLHGNPPEIPGCAVEVQPSVLNFGLKAIGSMTHMTARVVAIGEDSCRVTNARLVNGAPAFMVTLPLVRVAFPGIGGVNIDVAYQPLTAASSSDLIQIDYEQVGGGTSGTIFVGVSGSAAEARICVMPPALDFGTVSQGSSASMPVTISSCGAVELDLRGVILSAGAGPFRITQSTAVPQVIAAGANAAPSLTVTYGPNDPGPHYGALELVSSDRTTPSLTVPLSGNVAGNCDQVVTCNPGTVAFGDTEIGTNKLVRVVCRSLGNMPVTINSAVLAGAGPELSVDAMTPVTLQPGDAWTFDVRYQPQAAAATTAMVTLNTNACVSPAPFPITGLGVERPLPPCQPPSTFSPRVQWSWSSTTLEPTFINVWSTPLVANLTDDNGDNRIDENDIPEVLFISLDTYSISDPNASIPAVLRVLRGDTGAELFSVDQPRFADTSLLAVGDLDGDGRPEIVGLKWVQSPMGTGMGGFSGRYVTGNLVALDNEGHLLWESDPWSWPASVLWNGSAPTITDLDGDGFAEIILGREVFDHRGHVLWRGTSAAGMVAAGPHSIAVDIDLDGHPEVLAGGTVYRGDGTIMWDVSTIDEGGTAVGVLDPLDPFPQIAVVHGLTLTVLDHLGIEKWHAAIPSMGPATQLPTIADFDGDGYGEIAVADGEMVHVFDGTGGIVWSRPVMDDTCCAGISAFDFEGDGAYELILTDYGTVYVYRGTNGTQLYSAPRPSVTAYEMPVVADIDNDGKGELVVANFGGGGGVTAYSNVGDTWVGAPRIFNQQAFYVTNVHESGAIPRVATPFTMGPKVFRGTSAACR